MALLSAVFFLVMSVVDARIGEMAGELRSEGVAVGASAVEVDVQWFAAKGGGHFGVNAVRVRLPGPKPGWVYLEEPSSGDIRREEVRREGWQAPFASTGYAARPLVVRYVVGPGGRVVAMAERDVLWWTERDRAADDRWIGVGLLGVCVLLTRVNVARVRRLRRERALRRGQVLPSV